MTEITKTGDYMCKGSLEIGSACMKCSRCIASMPEYIGRLEAQLKIAKADPAAAESSSPETVGALFAAKKRIMELEEYAKDEAETLDQWRNLAMQFDRHRMQALGHLRAVMGNPGSRHEIDARQFLEAGPMAGEKALAERLAALPLQALSREKLLRAEVDARYIFGDGGQAVLDVIEWYAATVALAIDAPRAPQNG